jgi:hypothetical protein
MRFSSNSRYQTLTALSAPKFVAKLTFSPHISSFDIVKLREQYSAKTLSPLEVIRHVYQKIGSYHDKAVWIHLIPEAESIIRVQELIQNHQSTSLPPLFGIPFSVKDSIDITGLPSRWRWRSITFHESGRRPCPYTQNDDRGCFLHFVLDSIIWPHSRDTSNDKTINGIDSCDRCVGTIEDFRVVPMIRDEDGCTPTTAPKPH